MDKFEKMYYICTEDGEIIETVSNIENYVKLDNGDRVLKRKSVEEPHLMKEINMRFAKVNFQVIGNICRKYSMFPYLIKYVGYIDGVLKYRNGKFVTKEKLPKICNLSEITTSRQLRGLIHDDILKMGEFEEEPVIYMNPFIVHLGKKINYSLYEMFENTEYRNSYEERCEK